MKKRFLFLLFWTLSLQAQTPICIGEAYTLDSQILGEKRTLDVYLPPSYHEKQIQPASYPVVYLLDAETNFRYFTTLMEKLQQGIPNVPEMIVIGIENNRREYDLSPIALKDKPQSTGGNARFLSFLKEEAVPWVESHYRCKDFRILVGHSLSGLATVNALVTQTELFHAYIAHDPSLWWGDSYGLKLFQEHKGKDFLNRILYISYSGEKKRENARNQHLATLKALQEMFFNGDFKNIQWKMSSYPKENHGSVQVMGNLQLIRELFAEVFIDRSEIQADPSVIDRRYEALSQKLHCKFVPSEPYLLNTERWLLNTGKKDAANEIQRRRGELYPEK